jgi:hypothetical protein
MSAQSAFHRGVSPLLQLLLPGREDAVLSVQTDQSLRERIEELAAGNTEGTLSPEELEEYAGYVRANKSTVRVLCMNSDEQLELRMAGE